MTAKIYSFVSHKQVEDQQQTMKLSVGDYTDNKTGEYPVELIQACLGYHQSLGSVAWPEIVDTSKLSKT